MSPTLQVILGVFASVAAGAVAAFWTMKKQKQVLDAKTELRLAMLKQEMAEINEAVIKNKEDYEQRKNAYNELKRKYSDVWPHYASSPSGVGGKPSP